MTSSADNDNNAKILTKHYIIILGAQRPRVAKAVSLLSDSNNDEEEQEEEEEEVIIEYLPCVASFGSYQDENGQNCRYLTSVMYHGKDGTNRKGSSLAPFFDEEAESILSLAEHEKKKSKDEFTCTKISGIAIGCGIEDKADICHIETFLRTLRGSGDNNNNKNTPDDSIPIRVLQPNDEYETMKEETEAYKAMNSQEKEKCTKLQTMGPAKMAKFVRDFTKDVKSANKEDGLGAIQEKLQSTVISPSENTTQTTTTTTVDENNNNANHTTSTADDHDSSEKKTDIEPNHPQPVNNIDPNQTRYACRKCRTILFGKNDLEDPPHVPSRHHFSYRKMKHSGGGGMNNGGDQCQNLFLNSSSPTVDALMDHTNNTMVCHYCHTKVGHWNWAGAQCSCGTWVTPAIQIPCSKVDVVRPYKEECLVSNMNVINPLLS